MRKFLSLVLALVMTMSLVVVGTSAKTFTDDSDINYDEAVDVVSAIGIMDGYSGGDFQPAGVLTRGAAAKIICNMVLGPTTASALNADTAPFPDVPANHVFAGYIAYCSQQGIINGYGDGYFRPGDTLTGYAFMKMLLTSLGYSTDAEGFTGPNWTINVAKLASNLGLDDGNDEFVGAAAVTRQEAALYAFNTLQADLVEYEKGNTVIINGQQITSSTDRKAKAIQWLNSSDADGNIDGTAKGDGYIQFAEQYFNKLKKIASTDSFARPSTKWTFKGDKIGNYVDTPDASYTSNVKLGQIYSDLNMTQKDKNAEVWVNGVQAYDVNVSSNNSLKIASDSANKDLVNDGSIVDVFYDEDENHVKICVVDVYVGTINNVVTKNVAEPYIMVTNYSVVYNAKGATAGTSPAKYNSGSGNITGNQCKYETEESFSEDDVVLFTFSQEGTGEIKDVWTPESVEGMLSKVVYDKSIELDGTTTYKYSKNVGFLENGRANDTELKTKSDYTVYLDDNGLVIYVAETEFNPDDYAFALYVNSTGSGKFTKDQAKLITSAGKVITVDTDDSYTELQGKVVLFRENSDGEYALREANNFGQTTGAKVADPVVGPTTNYTPADNADTGVTENGSTTFVMKNDNAKITFETGVEKRANSETVFVTAETINQGVSTETFYNAYVGVKNAPSIASDYNDIDMSSGATSAKVEAFWAERSNGLLAFVFIDITEANYTNGKKDIVFFAGEKGMSKRTQNSDGKYYYTYNAVVDGEITTLDVIDTLVEDGFVAGKKVNGAFTNVQYDNKGYVKSVKAIDTVNDYDVLVGDTVATRGVWKLSGKYSVGLGPNKVRETVSDSAKIYYVDQDGVITKKDSMSEVYSDTAAKFIALRDIKNGDIEYLFIQEPDNNKTETSGTPVAPMTSISATYSDPTLSIVVAGGSGTYTLAWGTADGGVDIDLGTVDAKGSDTTNVSLPSLATGRYYLKYIVDGKIVKACTFNVA